jgi:hypothetical protein
MNVEAAWEAEFRIQRIGIGDSEMMAIALKKGGDGQAGEKVGRDGVAGHDVGPGGLGKRGVIFREARSRDRASVLTIDTSCGDTPCDYPSRLRLDQLLRSEVARLLGSRRNDVVPSPGTCSIQFLFRTR